AFELLETARLFKRVRSVTNPQVPLLSHSSDKKFKAIMLDIGYCQISVVYQNLLIFSNWIHQGNSEEV
ncbi:MAG: hypothetical protein PHZ24_08195, partial [Bacteroidales bacterium]|nr:hypothetical protein [Bacteroidales bacterium]